MGSVISGIFEYVTGSDTSASVGSAATSSRLRSIGVGTEGLSQAALNNRANQLNPNHVASGPGRFSSRYRGLGTPADLNNYANMMNPNNPLYYASRGMSNN